MGLSIFMNIQPFLDDISNCIENNITEPEKILKTLYEKHLLLPDNPTLTRRFTKYLFTSSLKDRHQESKGEYKIETPKSSLEEIFDLYHDKKCSKATKKRIRCILSAYCSYFPNELKYVPLDIQSQLKRMQISDFIGNIINQHSKTSLLSRPKSKETLTPLESCIKQEKIIRDTLKAMRTAKNNEVRLMKSTPLSFLTQSIKSIALLSPDLHRDIINEFIHFIEKNAFNADCENFLKAYSDILATLPESKKRISQIIHKILCAPKESRRFGPGFVFDYSWAYAAQCWEELISEQDFHEINKILDLYLKRAKNVDGQLQQLLFSVPKALFLCDRVLAEKIVSHLSDVINSPIHNDIKLNSMALLGKFSQWIATLPESIVHKIKTDFVALLPVISEHSNRSQIKNISQLQSLFDKTLNEEILLNLFNNLFIRKSNYKSERIGYLFYLWNSVMKEKEFLPKMHQHFTETDPSAWISPECLKYFCKSYKPLALEVSSLVNFFMMHLESKDQDIRLYAIRALVSLKFSLEKQANVSFTVLNTLVNSLPDTDEETQDSLIHSLVKLSNISVVHPTLIKPIIMTCVYFSDQSPKINKALDSLFQYANPDLFTAEEKQTLLDYYGSVECMGVRFVNVLNFFYPQQNKLKLIEEKVLIPERTSSEMDAYSYGIASAFLKITCDLRDHSRQLSWLCATLQFMKNCNEESEMKKSLYQSYGLTFYHVKRQEFLLEHLPRVVTDCISDYIPVRDTRYG